MGTEVAVVVEASSKSHQRQRPLPRVLLAAAIMLELSGSRRTRAV
jgi:hypothetical protein